MKIKIELEKTVQVRQYEPLRVCIAIEDAEAESIDAVNAMYKDASVKLHSMIKREYAKFDDEQYDSARPVQANTAKAAEPRIPRLKKKTKVVSATY